LEIIKNKKKRKEKRKKKKEKRKKKKEKKKEKKKQKRKTNPSQLVCMGSLNKTRDAVRMRR
jgi:hypothetical protein